MLGQQACNTTPDRKRLLHMKRTAHFMAQIIFLSISLLYIECSESNKKYESHKKETYNHILLRNKTTEPNSVTP
jgi:hypothetical protein